MPEESPQTQAVPFDDFQTVTYEEEQAQIRHALANTRIGGATGEQVPPASDAKNLVNGEEVTRTSLGEAAKPALKPKAAALKPDADKPDAKAKE